MHTCMYACLPTCLDVGLSVGLSSVCVCMSVCMCACAEVYAVCIGVSIYKHKRTSLKPSHSAAEEQRLSIARTIRYSADIEDCFCFIHVPCLQTKNDEANVRRRGSMPPLPMVPCSLAWGPHVSLARGGSDRPSDIIPLKHAEAKKGSKPSHLS